MCAALWPADCGGEPYFLQRPAGGGGGPLPPAVLYRQAGVICLAGKAVAVQFPQRLPGGPLFGYGRVAYCLEPVGAGPGGGHIPRGPRQPQRRHGAGTGRSRLPGDAVAGPHSAHWRYRNRKVPPVAPRLAVQPLSGQHRPAFHPTGAGGTAYPGCGQ